MIRQSHLLRGVAFLCYHEIMKIVFDGHTKRVVSDSEAKRLTGQKKSPWTVVEGGIIRVDTEGKEKHALEVEKRKKEQKRLEEEAVKAAKTAEKKLADEDAKRVAHLEQKRETDLAQREKTRIEKEKQDRIDKQNAERQRIEKEKHQRQLDLQAARAQNKK